MKKNERFLALSPNELNRLRKDLIGDKYPYYEKAFTRLEKRRPPYSFNIAGFLAGYFWAFYRGMYGAGLIAMVTVFASLYFVLSLHAEAVTPLVILGNVTSLLPSLIFGFFGNALYKTSLNSLIAEGLSQPYSKQEKFFKEYRGGNVRIVLGLLFASVFIFTALLLSTASR